LNKLKRNIKLSIMKVKFRVLTDLKVQIGETFSGTLEETWMIKAIVPLSGQRFIRAKMKKK